MRASVLADASQTSDPRNSDLFNPKVLYFSWQFSFSLNFLVETSQNDSELAFIGTTRNLREKGKQFVLVLRAWI